MRITVELPDELMRAAKARAAESGESLKDLFARALAKEIGRRSPASSSRRVTLPLIARDAAPSVAVSNDEIAEALAAVDAELYGNP
jgi:hypothetical protein